jgi:hypothetical protein
MSSIDYRLFLADVLQLSPVPDNQSDISQINDKLNERWMRSAIFIYFSICNVIHLKKGILTLFFRLIFRYNAS